MKRLLTIRPSDVGAKSNPSASFYERLAARAVFLTDQNGVYLIHMKTRNYYKLPGGGIGDGEDIETALHRELLEECGTDGEIIGEVGEVEEFRENDGLHQISYCYLVQQSGKRGVPEYTEDELSEQTEVYIADSIHEAIQLVKGSTPADDECRFIQKRDGELLLQAAQL